MSQLDKSIESKLKYFKIFGRTLASSFLSVIAIISLFLKTSGVGIFSNSSLHINISAYEDLCSSLHPRLYWSFTWGNHSVSKEVLDVQGISNRPQLFSPWNHCGEFRLWVAEKSVGIYNPQSPEIPKFSCNESSRLAFKHSVSGSGNVSPWQLL